MCSLASPEEHVTLKAGGPSPAQRCSQRSSQQPPAAPELAAERGVQDCPARAWTVWGPYPATLWSPSYLCCRIPADRTEGRDGPGPPLVAMSWQAALDTVARGATLQLASSNCRPHVLTTPGHCPSGHRFSPSLPSAGLLYFSLKIHGKAMLFSVNMIFISLLGKTSKSPSSDFSRSLKTSDVCAHRVRVRTERRLCAAANDAV